MVLHYLRPTLSRRQHNDFNLNLNLNFDHDHDHNHNNVDERRLVLLKCRLTLQNAKLLRARRLYRT